MNRAISIPFILSSIGLASCGGGLSGQYCVAESGLEMVYDFDRRGRVTITEGLLGTSVTQPYNVKGDKLLIGDPDAGQQSIDIIDSDTLDASFFRLTSCDV